ncbi:uncharacterized protein [Pyrus communis]|uniref:uncharacterized protein n=1 Tax=Pyrus communis TaxID=23211 RepID=UPI0035C19184
MPSESEEKEKYGNQRKDDKGKGQTSLRPRKTQCFKRGGTSSSSSSGGFSATGQGRGGRFFEGPRGQRQGDTGRGRAPLYRRCNNRHFGECRRGSSGCFTCGQMGHRAANCPQSQQRPQQSFLPSPAPIQQVPGPGSYGQSGRGGAYYYQGGYMPYPLIPAGGSQWYQGGQPPQGEIATNSAGSSRQSGQLSQGRNVQGQGDQTSRGRGGQQQPQGCIHNISLQDAQNNPDLIMVTQLHPTPLGYDLEFAMPREERCYVDYVYPGCPVMVEDVVMLVDLIPLDIVDFDVILGTDWLHFNRSNIDCYEKIVTFHRPGLPVVTFVGEQSGVRHGVISAVRAKRLLSKGCQGYLAHVVLNDVAPSSMEDVRVVRHFPDVFPYDLPELPPD